MSSFILRSAVGKPLFLKVQRHHSRPLTAQPLSRPSRRFRLSSPSPPSRSSRTHASRARRPQAPSRSKALSSRQRARRPPRAVSGHRPRQGFLPVFVVLAPTLEPPNAIARSQRLPSDRLNNPPKEAVRIFRPVSRVDEKVIYLSIGIYLHRQQYLREIRNMQIQLYLHFST